ncbi:shikimate kinase [Thomasclavelia sp.]|uniref:shikimate kinase n=1 Tax=Thomasclavelia sp. TaxID=3025757 RepID=UPI00345C80C4
MHNVGKSTVGKILANKLDYPFIYVDEETKKYILFLKLKLILMEEILNWSQNRLLMNIYNEVIIFETVLSRNFHVRF